MRIIKKIKSFLIFISVVTLFFVIYFISSTFFEPKAYNFFVQNFSASKVGSEDIVLIVIDDKSLSKIRWPWKRELYGQIFNFLNEYSRTNVIGFDAIFRVKDNENENSDIRFYNDIKKIRNLVVGFALSIEPTKDTAYNKKFNNKFGVQYSDERDKKYKSPYKSLSVYPEQYFNAVQYAGSVMTTPDMDGYIRAVDQLVNYDGNLYPSLSLRIYGYLNPSVNLKIKDKTVTTNMTPLKIPVYSKNKGVFNNIRYYRHLPNSEYSHKTFSAIDVIESYEALKQGKEPIISPHEFDNKIVFVGANAKAIAVNLNDVKKTPMSDNYPGVDIQATNLDNILHNEFITLSSFNQDIITLIILLGATFLIIKYSSLFVSISSVAAISVLYLILSAVCYRFGFAVSVITPLTMQIVMMTVAYSYRFILEGRNKEKIKNAMGKYISTDVMENVVKNIDDVKLGGKRAEVTILFADIRGFTSMSEKISAEEVSMILNEYFSAVEPIITKYNGVINKFIGDAVMAIFGEPIQDKNHVSNAVKCANEMLKEVAKLREKWIDEGKPKIEIGIGINTGEAFVGNIGSEKRLEYTVIGDVVNLASRIESYNKVYRTNFLISSSTYEKVRNIADVIKISDVSIRGKEKKLDIYEVLRLIS
ncbi:adenylate/guanylate cyclase domain-containing protein [bacterium]|nr:adenylate/guanylate cyclase domain-containing protein [bacterium]